MKIPRGGAALPEDRNYVDTGCAVAPACLACPLPACVHDDPKWRTRVQREELVALVQGGMAVKAAARQVRVSDRNAYRFMKEAARGETG